MEHPLGTSWGYQLTGYFALSSYYGTPEEFQDFVEACHLENIGVFVDWVPGHFCVNDDSLAIMMARRHLNTWMKTVRKMFAGVRSTLI